MNTELKQLRRVSEAAATAAMVACMEIITEKQAGLSPAGILARCLRKELLAAPPGPARDAMLEGFCDTLQRFIEVFQPGTSPIIRRGIDERSPET